ncbi:putative ferric-chelate reductase 1 [Carcharodon carcharias]|uniref:putative ferric-chelate reductase 1 n=1 Tax=Carcharodon carcharias TaxID=13397 RepID=UPI001B7E22A2|nr:putative ferric-chelate reductase 1 [Carcharodon carcharias]
MRRHTCFVLAFITITFLVYVSGYSDGKVSMACGSMLPKHGASSEQTTDPPYQIIASSSSFNPGDIIQVTLRSNPGIDFKGFLLEARSADASTSVTFLGTFSITSSKAQLLDCHGDGITYRKSAVSQTSAIKKSEIIVNWTASDTGNIQFRAAVVQTFSKFWTQVKSQIIERSVTSDSPTTINTSTIVTSVSPTMTTLLQTVTQPQGISSDGCGTTKFCFNNPARCNPASDGNCFFMSSTPLGKQGLQFEMSGRATGYISIGFSDDKIMGNDDNYICGKDNSGNVQVQRAYSTGKELPRTEQLGEVNNVHTADVNGVIQCSFITRNNISIVQRASNNLYYLFFAYGPSAGGQIRKHPEIPFISEEKVDVSVIQSASGNNGRSILTKVHGALMLIAWMTTGNIGMIIAKFFRSIGGSRKILGKDIWFQLHSFLMVLTVAATIIGFVLIFVKEKGWSSNAGAHPALGCIVMGLALIQPTVAMCRPTPNDKRRYIFNWFHAFMALVIKCLAVATLFLGFNLINVTANRWPEKVLGGLVGWEALLYIMLSVYCYTKGNALYVNLRNKVEPDLLILIVYLCGNLAFLIALLVGIGQS